MIFKTYNNLSVVKNFHDTLQNLENHNVVYEIECLDWQVCCYIGQEKLKFQSIIEEDFANLKQPMEKQTVFIKHVFWTQP